jgi:hypothetical protein
MAPLRRYIPVWAKLAVLFVLHVIIDPLSDAAADRWHAWRQPRRERHAARRRQYELFAERVDRTIAENLRRWGRPI